MRILNIVLNGKPISEQRARSGKGHFYNPQAQQMIISKREIIKQLPELFEPAPKGTPVILNCTCFFEPSATAKKKKGFVESIMNDDVPYTMKPDIDNLQKWVMDRMNKVIYYDDCQVYSCRFKKFYSVNPRTEIEIIY